MPDLNLADGRLLRLRVDQNRMAIGQRTAGNRPLIPGPLPMGLLRNAWRRLKEFLALGGNATYLWPRWIVLRAVGLVYVIVFAGIIDEGRALVGPHGIENGTGHGDKGHCYIAVPSNGTLERTGTSSQMHLG